MVSYSASMGFQALKRGESEFQYRLQTEPAPPRKNNIRYIGDPPENRGGDEGNEEVGDVEQKRKKYVANAEVKKSISHS